MHISRPCQIQILKARSFRIYEDVIKADPNLYLTRPHRYIPEMEHYANKTRNITKTNTKNTATRPFTMTCEMEYRDNCGMKQSLKEPCSFS